MLMLCNKLDFYLIFLEGLSLFGEFVADEIYLLSFIYLFCYFNDLLFCNIFYSLSGLSYFLFEPLLLTLGIRNISGEFLDFFGDNFLWFFSLSSSSFLNAECFVFRMTDYLLAYLRSLFQVCKLILNERNL